MFEQGDMLIDVTGGPITDSRELDELRSVTSAFMKRYSSESAVRELMDSRDGFDSDVWRRCCEELALPSLIVPTTYGGMGYGWRELGIVLRELGARLYTGPFLSTVFATTALLRLCSEEACAELLPGIVSGARLTTFAASRSDWAYARNNLQISGGFSAGWLEVSGSVDFVLDGHIAEQLIVFTSVLGRDTVLLIDMRDSAVAVTPVLGMDQTRRLSRVDLNRVLARDITSESLSPRDAEKFYAVLCVALSAEQLGGANEAFEITLDYVRNRVQFGRAIGSFQSVKHRCADLAVALENSRATVESALAEVDLDSPDLIVMAHVAAALCSETYMRVTREMIQLHGGVGFTWEHSAHLYLKRAKTSQMMLGIPEFHRRLIARELGLVANKC